MVLCRENGPSVLWGRNTALYEEADGRAGLGAWRFSVQCGNHVERHVVYGDGTELFAVGRGEP